MRRARHRQPAQALVWAVVMLPLFLAIVGLAIDGQAVLRAHRRAQGAADGAARTGAAQIQVPHARGDPAQADLLDPVAAQRAAEAYVAETYPDLRLRATADDNTIVVVVEQQVTPTFLQLLHVGPVPVQARSQARPRGGIDRPVQTP